MAQQWTVGDQVRLKVTVTDTAGTATDPTTISVRVRTPSGTIRTPSVVRDAVGQYHADVALDEAGVWQWEWVTSGNLVLVEGDERYVYPRRT